MKIISKNVPTGTRDLVFEEVLVQNELEHRIFELHMKLGFLPVSTPTLEFYDIFDHGHRSINEESIYKLTDLDGKLVALRPDNTAPIVRVVSTRLAEMELPLYLCYSQNIYRNSIAYNAERSEILQSGVELIGGDSFNEDIRALFTAFETLEVCEEDYKIEIGHSEFFDAMLSAYALEENESKDLKNYMAVKNSSGFSFSFDKVNPEAVELANRLSRLCGGVEALEEAKKLAKGNKKAEDILNYLEKIYDVFNAAGFGNKLLFDFGIVQAIDYYTGIVFRGYVNNIGEAVLSGGRYDELFKSFGKPYTACGFAINVTEVAAKHSGDFAGTDKTISFSCDVQSLIEADRAVKKVRDNR